MPTGVYVRKNKNGEQPAPGGAVREPIRNMLAPGSEEDFKESLPESTASEPSLGSPLEEKPKRKPYTKRAKPEDAAPVVDKRLERAQSKCVGLGLAGVTEAGFIAAGKPLNTQEAEDVGDQFYLITKKIGGNGDSWVFVIIYTIVLLAKLIMIRTELGEEVQEWIKKMFQPKEAPTQEQTEEKK